MTLFFNQIRNYTSEAMKKIPFDIKLWPEIESGRYKVVTEHGEPVEIVKWDCKGVYPILAVIDDGDTEDSCFFNADGTSLLSKEKLFILTDEPEPTEFQKRLVKFYNDRNALTHDADGQYNRHDLEEVLNTAAGELLELARKELENSDWIKDIREWCYNKGHLEGYAKGQEDAEKRHKEATSFHYDLYPLIHPVYPPCYVSGPCTNPHHDCINCPRTGTSGIAKTDTNIKYP